MAFPTSFGYFLLALLGLGSDPEHAPITGPKCRGLRLTDPTGTLNCTETPQMKCVVHCDGWYHGNYKCNEEGNWTPTLPRCAKPVTVQDRVIALRNGCPDDAKCSALCKADPDFKSEGYCTCRNKKTCNCQPRNTPSRVCL